MPNKYFALIVIFITIVTSMLLPSAATCQESFYVITDSTLKHFEECQFSPELKALKIELIETGIPKRKDGLVWSYAAKGNVMGLPFHEISVGVCDNDGGMSCGWTIFTSFVLESGKEEARKTLLESYKVDFAEPKRGLDDETLRPLLSSDVNTKYSILFCDSGSL